MRVESPKSVVVPHSCHVEIGPRITSRPWGAVGGAAIADSLSTTVNDALQRKRSGGATAVGSGERWLVEFVGPVREVRPDRISGGVCCRDLVIGEPRASVLGPADAPADCEPGYKDPDRDCEHSTDQERLRQRHDRIVASEHCSCKRNRAERQIGPGGEKIVSGPDAVYLCCMSSTRTQVYLTEEQRRKVDQMADAEGVTMAVIIRRALDEYLTDDADASTALTATFGAAPDADVPSRDEWQRG